MQRVLAPTPLTTIIAENCIRHFTIKKKRGVLEGWMSLLEQRQHKVLRHLKD